MEETMGSFSDSSQFSRLPEPLVSNIFHRLTVKDLSQNKSVCKSWNSLISSRHFINTHLVKSINDYHHQLLICTAPFLTHKYRPYIDFTVRSDKLKLGHCSVSHLLDETVPKVTKYVSPFTEDRMDNWTYVVDYCNGLFCLACFDGRVYLWNPLTRKSRKLPEYIRQHTAFGFGYDESKDDFKVYSIIGDSDNQVSVYSSNSNCWRVIGDFPFGKLSLETFRGKFAHGAIHWVVSQGDGKEIIVSLDVKTETHAEVVQPNYGKDAYKLILGTLGDSLSVLCQYETGADLWVLEEYGVEESWTKLFTFPIPDYIPWKPRMRPICRTVNGEIMLLSDDCLILYKPKEKDYMIQILFEFPDNPSYNVFQELNVYTYVESLVSP